MVAEKLLDAAALSQEDKDLINALSEEEVDAVIKVGLKVVSKTGHGKATVKVAF
jgi:hypothetical protein